MSRKRAYQSSLSDDSSTDFEMSNDDSESDNEDNPTLGSYHEFVGGNFITSTVFEIGDSDSDIDDSFLLEGEPVDDTQNQPVTVTPTNVEESVEQTPAAPEVWTWCLGGNTKLAQPFDNEVSGWKVDFGPQLQEVDYLNFTFTEELVNLIVQETNKYADQQLNSSILETSTSLVSSASSTRSVEFEVTPREIMRYLAIRLIMGIDKKPELSHYWSRDPVLKSSIIPSIMPRDRFFKIQKYLHFSDSTQQRAGDKLHKVRRIWELAMTNFKSLLEPYENLSCDESLMKFKGRLGIRQYIPTKRNRFGVKIFSIVDEKTGFILNSMVYAGKDDEQFSKYDKKIFGYGGAIVLNLCENYFSNKRTLYCDNYFTSPSLAQKLADNTTYLCGTLRANRKNIPKSPFLKKGECVSFTCEKGDVGTMIEFWKDKRIVRMISTGMEHKMITVTNKYGKEQLKPFTVTKYNKHARGIDLADMHIQLYDSGRKTLKWSTKLFFHLFETTIYNAFVMFKSQRGKSSFLNFRLALIRQILENTGGIPTEKPFKIPIINNNGVPNRLTERHFPVKLLKPKVCKVCHEQSKKSSVDNSKRARSKYGCKNCDVALCTVPCFEVFHTKLHF